MNLKIFFAVLSFLICSQSYALNISENFDVSEGNFQYNGNAHWDVDRAILTNDSYNQVGSIWYKNPINLSQFSKITVEFTFFIGSHEGADGITFALIDTNNSIYTYGGSGGALGFGGIPNSFAVEIDTYYNYGVDPTPQDHVGIDLNGNIASINSSPIPNVEDNNEHHAKIIINLKDEKTIVFIDGIQYLEMNTIPTLDNVYIGFTGATGGQKNLQYIDNLNVELEPIVQTGEKISPNSYDFGEVWKGSPSDPLSVTITNTTSNPFNIKGVHLRGKFANNFQIIEDECSEVEALSPGETCNIKVIMNPTEVGKMKAVLKVITSEENGILYCHLKGTGRDINEPDINSDDNTFDFGNIVVISDFANIPHIDLDNYIDEVGNIINEIPVVHNFHIQNIGTENLRIDNVVIHGKDKNDFSITLDTCSGEIIEPSGECNLIVTFIPSSTGYKKAVIRILSNDPDESPYYIKLRGTGIEPDIDFGIGLF